MSDKDVDTESKSTQPTPSYEREPVKEDLSQDGRSLVVDSPGVPQRGGETYRLYKRRFTGLVALVSRQLSRVAERWIMFRIQVLLNIVAGMSWPWFGPISNNSGSYDSFVGCALSTEHSGGGFQHHFGRSKLAWQCHIFDILTHCVRHPIYRRKIWSQEMCMES